VYLHEYARRQREQTDEGGVIGETLHQRNESTEHLG
jgi:hypothetical protein